MKFNKVFNNALIALGIRKKPAPKKTSEIISEVRQHFIDYPSTIFLCNIAKNCLPHPEYTRFVNIIDTLLGRSDTLETWLRSIDGGGISDSEWYAYEEANLLGEKLYATRVAWLDYLIEEYKQKGD